MSDEPARYFVPADIHDQVVAERDAFRKDAERYRWLAKKGGMKWNNPIGSTPKLATGVLYDIAVDHLMGQEAP